MYLLCVCGCVCLLDPDNEDIFIKRQNILKVTTFCPFFFSGPSSCGIQVRNVRDGRVVMMFEA